MQFEIKHLHEKLGITVVYVTHDQSEALTMSNRIAVFNDGVIQQLSTPAELYEAPINSFVAQFIGENNRLNGVIKEARDGFCQVELPSAITVGALQVNGSKAGDKTTLSLRPERVVIEPTDPSVSNRLEGEIRELIYLGDHIRTRLLVAGNDDFVVKVPNRNREPGLRQGARVMLGWRTEDCRALDPLN
jgi:putative spermidine/putrescine transport system ATP-binding protein